MYVILNDKVVVESGNIISCLYVRIYIVKDIRGD